MKQLHIQRYLITGVLTVFPLWLTYVVFEFILRQLGQFSAPLLEAVLARVAGSAPLLGFVNDVQWIRASLAVAMTLLSLYGLGWLANRVIGKRLLALMDALLARIPLVQTIYGGTKKLLTVLQQKPQGSQRVVLIDFPHREMKAIGFVTRVLRDETGGGEIAAVYVPTTPNPTSGYLELVPVERLTPTDWTVDQAMALIISGGAVSPDTVPYTRSDEAPRAPGP